LRIEITGSSGLGSRDVVDTGCMALFLGSEVHFARLVSIPIGLLEIADCTIEVPGPLNEVPLTRDKVPLTRDKVPGPNACRMHDLSPPLTFHPIPPLLSIWMTLKTSKSICSGARRRLPRT